MDEQQIMINKKRKEEETEDINNDNSSNIEATECVAANREGRRKLAKKEKRKKKRKELAEMVRQEEEARLNDPDELLRLQAEEEREKARMERERREFEEREKKIMEEWERRRALEEEEEERRGAGGEEDHLKGNQVENENDADEDGWEYVEEGPPEIIWQGNEIIVKKKKVRVKKKDADQKITKEDPNRPTSNPLPPQSEAFVSYKNGSNPSAQQILENVANQTPNFGTEQDKAHCPFHLKTGACRFGSHCSRIHFYPDKSHTLLIKNMYNGPGLAWEQDDGLEHTDEEVEHAYEEFYEDVHTEFLKFGEIVNFKVCRNGSSHLRGNVYVHYKSVDSSVLAYESVNGRYFAGKQVQCEFVSVTRWKVAICGEFMKSELKACSRGTACNFIHCFRNPSGDYEWADWDKPPPRYWVQNMAALFGGSDAFAYDKHIERGSPRPVRNSSRTSTNEADRYHSRRAQSRDINYSRGSRNHTVDDIPISAHQRRYRLADRKQPEIIDKKHRDNRSLSKSEQHRNNASTDSDSDRNSMERKRARNSFRKRSRSRSNGRLEFQGGKSNVNGADPDTNMFSTNKEKYTQTRHLEKSSGISRNGKTYKKDFKSPDDDWDDGAEDGSCIFEEKCSNSDDDSEQASGDRSCRSYGSTFRPRKDTGKSEHKDGRKKYEEKSKRKRDTEERGRWEPE